ncbi:MAG TPA: S-layer homology domain-containing protein, partial [Firmicutes bacterium]|nr:S-layer homology domain-containing protein [Bacillota bacterium]
GHWGEAYIKYCYSQGIISGRGNGVFDPNANVTSAEASKMLLTAIGYNSNVQGYTGPQWAINVTRDAQMSGFYEGVSVPANQALTRDQAAQMIYNAVDATLIEKHSSIDRVDGTITDSYIPNENGDDLLSETFDVVDDEGVLTYDPTSDYNEDKGEYTYAVNGTDYTTTVDYTDLYQMNVKVLYKVNKDNTKTVYGIYPEKSSVIASGVIGDITEPASGTGVTKVEIGSTEYKLSKDAQDIDIVEFLAGATASDLDQVDTYATTTNGKIAYEFDLIDNDGDGKGDVVVVYPYTVEKVTYVGSTSITTSAVVAGQGGGSAKIEDVNVYSGIAKDDYVKVTAAANTATNTETFEELTLVTAKAEAVRVSDGEVRFNNTWYKTDILGLGTLPNAGDDCEYVEVNGYIFYLDGSTDLAGVEDFVLVTASATNTAGIDNTKSVRILKSDGTTEQVEVSEVGGSSVTSGAPIATGLYMFEIDDDGYYELTAVSSVTAGDTDFDTVSASSNTWTAATSSANAYVTVSTNRHYIADDAVVFVFDGADKYSVTTGAQLKATSTAVTVNFIGASNSSATGYSQIALAYVTSGSLGKTTDTYGFVTDNVVKYQEGTNKYYVEINIGTETLTTVSGVDTSGVVADAYSLSKGDVFKYTLNGEGKVDSITKYGMNIMVAADATETTGNIDFHAAIVGYEDNNIRFSNHIMTTTTSIGPGATSYDTYLTDDTVILYVNSADNEVVEGGSIQLASGETISGDTGYYANAYAVVDASNEEILLLVVDVNNDILNIQ